MPFRFSREKILKNLCLPCAPCTNASQVIWLLAHIHISEYAWKSTTAFHASFSLSLSLCLSSFSLFVWTDRESRYTAFSGCGSRCLCISSLEFEYTFSHFLWDAVRISYTSIRWSVERIYFCSVCTNAHNSSLYCVPHAIHTLIHGRDDTMNAMKWHQRHETWVAAIAGEGEDERNKKQWCVYATHKRVNEHVKCIWASRIHQRDNGHTKNRQRILMYVFSVCSSVCECVWLRNWGKLLRRMRSALHTHTQFRSFQTNVHIWRCIEQFPFLLRLSLTQSQRPAEQQWSLCCHQFADAPFLFWLYSRIPYNSHICVYLHIASFIPMNFGCLTVKSLPIYFSNFFLFSFAWQLLFIRNYHPNADWLCALCAAQKCLIALPSHATQVQFLFEDVFVLCSLFDIAAICNDNENETK